MIYNVIIEHARMRILFLGILLIFSGCAVAQGLPEWDNIEVLQINRESSRTSMMVYDTREQARVFDRERSPYFKSLNGTWNFHWVRRPADRPGDFHHIDFDDSEWGTIPVPSNWEVEGHGVAIYSNIRYPFEIAHLRAPYEWNPVGSYRRVFNVPEHWEGRQIFLNFDGVASAYYVWVNGERVGYSQDSRTMDEFDITEYLREGENQIAVEVYRWSDGAYLEDQDFWRLSGIFRDVYLWSTPQKHLRDYVVTSTLDDAYRHGIFDLSGEVAIYSNQAGGMVSIVAELYDTGQNLVHRQEKQIETEGRLTEFRLGEVTIDEPSQWSAETPYLYELYLTVRNGGGEVLSVIPQRVGFRRVEISDGRIRVNGQPIRLKGVNRHEQSLYNAHTITRQEMIDDIKLMKRNNINAVRTAHYPNYPLWYELCDKYGLYVMNEANLETHEFGSTAQDNILANHPDWKKPMLDRVQRMLYRDRNHPSIIMWSLGNESGDGPNMEAIYRWVKETDPSRLYHYQGTTTILVDEPYYHADFVSWMYALPEQCETWTIENPDIPLILCEYSHAMGNSNGNLGAYWDLIYENNSFQGGFVWDWVDQGIRQPVPDRFRPTSGIDHFIAYGGWFEDPHGIQHDGNFNMNGLLRTDRNPSPALNTLKYFHQFVQVEPVDWGQGRFQVLNRYDFVNLDEKLKGRWEMIENGKVIKGGMLQNLDIAPWESREVRLPLAGIDFHPNREYHLNFLFSKREKTFFADQGYEMGWEQFRIPQSIWPELSTPAKVEPLNVSLNSNHFTVAGDGFFAVFDVLQGTMESYNVDGEQVISAGPAIDFWRAMTDNDRGAIRSGRNIEMMRWRGADQTIVRRVLINGEQRQHMDYSRVPPQHNMELVFEMDLPAIGASLTVTYDIYQDGSIDITTEYEPGEVTGLPDFMPRYGNRLKLSPGFDRIEWYGRGPRSSYEDRKVERVGIYRSTVTNEWVDYSRPQENGYKTDVRWVTFTDSGGTGVRFTGDPLIGFGAKHYDRNEMESVRYTYEMEARRSIFVNIDYKQMGVGGYDSWSPRSFPVPEFRVKNESMSYRYRIEPVRN